MLSTITCRVVHACRATDLNGLTEVDRVCAFLLYTAITDAKALALNVPFSPDEQGNRTAGFCFA